MSLFYRFWRRICMGWFSGSVFCSSSKMSVTLSLACLILLFCVLVAACSESGTTTPGAGTNAAGVQATPGPVALTDLHWCGKPAMTFRDQADPNAAKTASQSALGPANGTPTAISDWNVVKSNLGFTIFLPKTLPAGSCLLNAASSLRDPIFGSNFTITYVLPDQSSISFSQAPLRAQSAGFQCNISDNIATKGSGTPVAGSTPTANADTVQLCNGARDQTDIVFSARGTTATLEQFFQALQPNVDWMPAK
jgi:hypothetical protein